MFPFGALNLNHRSASSSLNLHLVPDSTPYVCFNIEEDKSNSRIY